MNRNLGIAAFVAAMVIIPLTSVNSVYAWDDCPHGEVNDPYPGDCSKYIDTDNDGICDHSQPAPEDRVTSTPVPTSTPVVTEPVTTSAPEEEHEEEDHEEMYSVEISGQEMKEMTLQEIADAWKIDVYQMIDYLKTEFNLTGDYAPTDMLDAMRDEYKFSPAQAKAVVETLAQEMGVSTVEFNAEENPNLVSNNSVASVNNSGVAESNSEDTKNIIGLVVLTLPLTALGGYVLYNKFTNK